MKIFEIIEIELENIKTYVSEKITFSNGNNVLIGENGAGKSTILECIYLALFGDTVPGRNLADMIRLGQKQGKITFRFSVDSINYRIEDVIVIKGDNRTTQNQVLINQDQGDTIAEGRNAVRVKIEELLDVDATTFISAIYASQGEIGKIITDKDSDRKKLFDRLFQIERCEKTWSNLSKVEKVINRNITDLENNISILKDDLIDLPEHQKQLSIKKTQLKQEKMDYSLLKNQFKEIDQKFKALEKLIEKHNKLLAKKNHINEQQKFLTDSISNQTNIIEE
ncbi:MAG: SMC family ATPase, partial [Asgard group archaeon]|nr:SMC family ATPase [Asgard group archaeon]